MTVLVQEGRSKKDVCSGERTWHTRKTVSLVWDRTTLNRTATSRTSTKPKTHSDLCNQCRDPVSHHTQQYQCSSPTATEFGGQINRNCLFWAVIHVLDSHQHLVCALCVALLQITSWQMNATSRTSTVNSSAFILSENQTQTTNDKQTATGCAAFVPFSLVLVRDTM